MLQDNLQQVRKPLVIAAGVLLATLLMGALAMYISLRSVGDGSRHIDFAVKAGSNLSNVSARLSEANLVGSETLFKLYMRLTGKAGRIKFGVYDLHDGMSAAKIAQTITSGKTKTISITIAEGLHNRQIADLFVEKKFFASRDEFLQVAAKKSILDKYKIPAQSAEGYLFPDTYFLPQGYPKDKIIEHMIEHFFEKAKEVKNFPTEPRKIHETVILASIVEREAKLKDERPLIAAVFHNRLRDSEPLESCATVQYLFEKPKARLFYKDLEVESPYNTYKVRGLPPGPIGSPGIAAINATVNPEKTDYKFFVLKGDDAHHFSKDFKEHNAAKKKYIGP
ncbi:endolytic transglycosylase MltG [Turneriella parva]|uniref:Endolytic murein transglycosylase n=1 Tax=Turneriella parva (strain ATCC BAA-1111 / DSM 21527 / NCTC 11395 / H) TaxID=869212 RepID=I4B5U7_TURPD|nr:endolytic transglycosylase MltG [Turneriella parva]AFM12654.1 aminodeoxychorismate lyase [Turneriella parva DSM 21527]